LSTAIIMEGYDTALQGPFFAFPSFLEKFGELTPDGKMEIPANWQNGLQNAAGAGGIIGLQLAGIVSERIGYRWVLVGLLEFPTGQKMTLNGSSPSAILGAPSSELSR
jgi:SP family general alpha glucoside:H+ symporter-like MFS transporter